MDPQSFIVNAVRTQKARIKNYGTRAVDNTLFVFRPDSGIPAAEVLKTVERLGQIFAEDMTELEGPDGKKYKLLPSYIRVIQGDGINPHSIIGILETLKIHGWCTDNIAFGCGGSLLQKDMTRDNFSFAAKANAFEDHNGVVTAIFKQTAGKESKAGRLTLAKTGHGLYETKEYQASLHSLGAFPNAPSGVLETIFENGNLTTQTTFEEVCKRCEEGRDLLDKRIIMPKISSMDLRKATSKGVISS